MNRYLINLALLVIFVVSGLVSLNGCSESTDGGSSYAELVTIYNTELQALDRLERKREELVAKQKEALGPSTEDAVKALDTLLSSAKEAGKELNLEGVNDPNELLDRAVAHAETVQGATAGLLESVSAVAEPTEEDVAKKAEQNAQYERELAEIDQQITEQKARVDRARKARDKAEAAQN